MVLNALKLSHELKSANIPNGGCNSNGIVWDVDGKTEIQTRPDVAAIIAAHNPTPEPEPGKTIKDGLKTKPFQGLSAKQKDDLLLLLCINAGLCDKDGVML